MARIERSTIDVCPAPDLAPLLLLDANVVVVGTGHLPIRAIPEQLLIALVGDAVVHHEVHSPRVCLGSAVHAQITGVEETAGLATFAELVLRLGEESRPGLLPLAVIASLTSGRTVVLAQVGIPTIQQNIL